MFKCILFSLLFLIGCQKSPPTFKGREIRINIASDPQTLDPRLARDLTSVTLMHMFYEGLTRTSKEGELEMALAKSVEVSDDGLQYRFSLKSSFWSNGDPVTSYDFSKSLLSILDPKFPTDIAYHLYGIKNAKAAKAGEVGLDSVGISTPDEHTLIVDLEYPIPYFLQLVSMSAFFPVHQKNARVDVDWSSATDTYICNGPFKLKSWRHGDQIEVVKNFRYWEAKDVRLSKIDLLMLSGDTEIQMFEEGKLDWAGSPLSTIPMDAIPTLRQSDSFYTSPFLATYFLRLNTSDVINGKQNPLSSVRFRRALALSIDRQAITDHLLQGGQVPALSLTPPAMGLSAKGYFEADHRKAFELLGASLLKQDAVEPIKISFFGSDRNISIMQAIQQQLENFLGIKVELEAVEPQIYFQRISNKEFQIAAGSWSADFNDPINFLEVFKYGRASTNNTNWELKEYTDLLDRSAFCLNLRERAEILHEAESLLMDEMPIIPVFHFALNYLKRKGLEGVVLSPLGKIDFRWAYTLDEYTESGSSIGR